MKKEKKQFKISAGERRGVLLLIPLLAILAWIIYSAARPRFDDPAGQAADVPTGVAGNETGSSERESSGAGAEKTLSPEIFDPNTVTFEQLRSMGLEAEVAASLVRWREYGKVFNIPEDFALVRGMTDSLYAIFKPYIKIGRQYRVEPRATFNNSRTGTSEEQGGRSNSRGRLDNSHNALSKESRPFGNADMGGSQTFDNTGREGLQPFDNAGRANSRTATGLAPFDPNVCSHEDFVALGFSPRQATVIINFRESLGGFRSAEDFARSYVVSPEMFDRLRDYIVIPAENSPSAESTPPFSEAAENPNSSPRRLLELNGADSLSLVAINGIGARSASDIMLYRKRLGGFHDIAQLRDLRVITEQNYALIARQIWADSGAIQKIDINFAPPEEIGRHPYITDRTLRRIFQQRQKKGGWRTIEDMIEDDTLTPEQASRLAPYLVFSTPSR